MKWTGCITFVCVRACVSKPTCHSWIQTGSWQYSDAIITTEFLLWVPLCDSLWIFVILYSFFCTEKACLHNGHLRRECSLLFFMKTWLKLTLPDILLEIDWRGLAIIVELSNPGHISVKARVCTPDTELQAVDLRPYYLTCVTICILFCISCLIVFHLLFLKPVICLFLLHVFSRMFLDSPVPC